MSTLPEHQNAIKFYKNLVGEDKFNQILKKCLQFLCHTPFEWLISTLGLTLVTGILLLYPVSSILHYVFLKSTARSLKHFLCRDTLLFEIIVVLENLWFFFSLKTPLDEVRNALTDTLSTHIHYFEEFAASPVSQPYFSGFLTIAVAFRFYFALKATRVFGPFTKLIKINAVSPLPWMLVTGLILLFSSSCLYVLLS